MFSTLNYKQTMAVIEIMNKHMGILEEKSGNKFCVEHHEESNYGGYGTKFMLKEYCQRYNEYQTRISFQLETDNNGVFVIECEYAVSYDEFCQILTEIISDITKEFIVMATTNDYMYEELRDFYSKTFATYEFVNPNENHYIKLHMSKIPNNIFNRIEDTKLDLKARILDKFNCGRFFTDNDIENVSLSSELFPNCCGITTLYINGEKDYTDIADYLGKDSWRFSNAGMIIVYLIDKFYNFYDCEHELDEENDYDDYDESEEEE